MIVIGIPAGYLHSHHGMAAYADFMAAVDLGPLRLWKKCRRKSCPDFKKSGFNGQDR